jgi:hypothetical protein
MLRTTSGTILFRFLKKEEAKAYVHSLPTMTRERRN